MLSFLPSSFLKVIISWVNLSIEKFKRLQIYVVRNLISTGTSDHEIPFILQISLHSKAGLILIWVLIKSHHCHEGVLILNPELEVLFSGKIPERLIANMLFVSENVHLSQAIIHIALNRTDYLSLLV